MSENNDELLEVAKDIRELLSRIYVCFEDQYLEIQRKKMEDKLEALKGTLTTPTRRKIYPLLFHSPALSQSEIAKQAGVSQQAVSRMVNALLDQDLIEQIKGENGNNVYWDKYDLAKLL